MLLMFSTIFSLSCSDLSAGVQDGCGYESKIRQSLNFKIRGCEFEYRYGCGDSTKNFSFSISISSTIKNFVIIRTIRSTI